MTDLGAALNTLLANVVAFAHKAHGYHWNVVGEDFHMLHAFFGEIYEDVQDSVDPLAENIRKVGDFPAFTITDLAARSVLSATAARDAQGMVRNLAADNETVLALLKSAMTKAKSDDHQGILNFLAERQDMHQKWGWQLRASIEEEA